MRDAIQVVVAHKGAREHFLAARALCRKDMLAALVTDWYSPLSSAWTRRLSRISPSLARAGGAVSDELPRQRVIGLNSFGLISRWNLRETNTGEHPLEAIGRNDAAFARRLARLTLPDHNVFLGYSYAALEMLEAEKARGIMTLVDQIDPGRTEWDLIHEEEARWPDYEEPGSTPPVGYYERACAEWKTADVTIVNSEWTRSALVQQGADPRRIEVVPLAYEAGETQRFPTPKREGALTVLWLGSVILRKGIQYLIEAARELAGEPVRFVVAGPSGIRAEAVRKAPPNIQWLGPVPRSEAQRLYLASDVFVLPTLSDGFAITQVEALAYGLPVIATPNCGAVVDDGRTGFMVPPRDAHKLAAAIRRFVKEPGLAGSMREACLESAARFSVAHYAERLASVIRKGLASRPPDPPLSDSGKPRA